MPPRFRRSRSQNNGESSRAGGQQISNPQDSSQARHSVPVLPVTGATSSAWNTSAGAGVAPGSKVSPSAPLADRPSPHTTLQEQTIHSQTASTATSSLSELPAPLTDPLDEAPILYHGHFRATPSREVDPTEEVLREEPPLELRTPEGLDLLALNYEDLELLANIMARQELTTVLPELSVREAQLQAALTEALTVSLARELVFNLNHELSEASRPRNAQSAFAATRGRRRRSTRTEARARAERERARENELQRRYCTELDRWARIWAEQGVPGDLIPRGGSVSSSTGATMATSLSSSSLDSSPDTQSPAHSARTSTAERAAVAAGQVPDSQVAETSAHEGPISQKETNEPTDKEPQEQNCGICRETITTQCHLHPCGHNIFDFQCILLWLQSISASTRDLNQMTCPLCRSVIHTIHYNRQSDGSHEVFGIDHHFPGYRGLPPGSRSMPINTPIVLPRYFTFRQLHTALGLGVRAQIPGMGLRDALGYPLVDGLVPWTRLGNYITDEEFEAGGEDYVFGLIDQLAVREEIERHGELRVQGTIGGVDERLIEQQSEEPRTPIFRGNFLMETAESYIAEALLQRSRQEEGFQIFLDWRSLQNQAGENQQDTRALESGRATEEQGDPAQGSEDEPVPDYLEDLD